MNLPTARSDAILLLTAAIWGFAFVAQRAGMEHVGPFFFNGVRFVLGACVVAPFWVFGRSRAARSQAGPPASSRPRSTLAGGAALGVLVFFGSSLQQMGIVHTTAGKAGFITGLYVILVPVLGIALGRRSLRGSWIGALLATVGLYLLTVTSAFTVERGDLLVLASAVFWALHVLALAGLSARIPAAGLATVQHLVCGVLSVAAAVVFEPVGVEPLVAAALPILYGGIMSVGVAYTLQVVAQKSAHATHAAIILSLEGVFAVIGGYLLLSETLSHRAFVGCALMFAGMVVSQTAMLRRAGKDRRSIETAGP